MHRPFPKDMKDILVLPITCTYLEIDGIVHILSLKIGFVLYLTNAVSLMAKESNKFHNYLFMFLISLMLWMSVGSGSAHSRYKRIITEALPEFSHIVTLEYHKRIFHH